MRDIISREVQAIVPFDQRESLDKQKTLKWIQSGAGLFRIHKPAVPDKHLVVYFVLVDFEAQSILLCDHILANLWLPLGGHVDDGEHPREAAAREAQEELGIQVHFGDHPLFLTYTTTNRDHHDDISLWYVLAGSTDMTLDWDPREMRDCKWFAYDEIKAMLDAETDPRLKVFVEKLKTLDNIPA